MNRPAEIELYVHIPFCHSKCGYCAFYSVVAPKWTESYVEALCREIALRGSEAPIRSLYFGGGTPSILSLSQLTTLMEALTHSFPALLSEDYIERTIEANPEDLKEENLLGWRRLGLNRLSIGVQSTDEAVLAAIGRRHRPEMVTEGLAAAAKEGFTSISADLIVGLPHQTEETLLQDIHTLIRSGVTHLSVYTLSIEPRTRFEQMVKRGEWTPLSDDQMAARYLAVCRELRNAGFIHYEVSNFARSEALYSRHNIGYWTGIPYVGLGASAHSFDGENRAWNFADIRKYTDALQLNTLPVEESELLSAENRHDERVMLLLRTREGIPMEELSSYASILEREGLMESAEKAGYLRFTEEGWLISDTLVPKLV